MSFFIPHQITCFICRSKIGPRVEAARLCYASPDDVGEVARHGRAWVHRSCWDAWNLRNRWAVSAANLLMSSPRSVRDAETVCSVTAAMIAIHDTLIAIEIRLALGTVPAVLLAGEVGGAVRIGASQWRFQASEGQHLQVEAEMDGEIYERFRLKPGRWSKALQAAIEIERTLDVAGE